MPMPISRAFVTLLAIIAAVAPFLALTYGLGITEYWAGFLVLLHWGVVEDLAPHRFVHSAAGAATGLAVAAMPLWLTPLMGADAAGLAALAITILAVFLLLTNWLPLLCNSSAMVTLTVGSIPHIAGHVPPAAQFAGLAAGILFYGALAFVAARVTAMRRPAPVPAE
jgi:hypothetical protein